MSGDTNEGVTQEDVEAAREEVVEAMARGAEAYGAKRSCGRLFGILYFAGEPMSLDDLVAHSGYAKSTVSTTMNTLERYHLVRRRSRPGEGKRAFFEATEDFWYVFQQFLEQQVRREVEALSRALAAAEMVLAEADDEAARRDLERVRTLERASERAERWLDVVTSQSPERIELVVDRLQDKAG